ncbi:hypothetical protein CWC00_13540 [Pseudoalteromonas rubra]|nr:hypothetical protein CWC00_13540 [Pseudoalteromonas rubra]
MDLFKPHYKDSTMKPTLSKKSIKRLNQTPLDNQQTHGVAGGNSQAPTTCPHTQPAWHCMSYLGCVSNKPQYGC